MKDKANGKDTHNVGGKKTEILSHLFQSHRGPNEM